ncbi:F0F1 ATP synthase subunit B' [Paenirhodobacter populi]|uniref:ATP synthase subunit b n=1 Tax=Paenirhodobacter populi TaxID=2306993 RepID=A0A443KC68_9RHOB|nr:F0F1 ATP synthase subunit B' [Sinirhodobacter populi]RWR07971.1 F0F1 ATP synthase subunit B' [Sinirhodobacter populi]RWR30316.1 F0F1 ATP synthase subunit B' [Sinirhodobacter populi]RWR32289.1 F0F1 ATP synthase subunit B' [Sinirhodobacter populi]
MDNEELAAEVAKESVPAGMPQLDFSSFPNQIFWLLVALVVTYLVLSRLALPRISAILAERQGSIAGDIAAAEEYKLKAKEAEAAYEKALAEARSQAQKIVGEARAEIKKDLDAAIATADEKIAARAAESEARIGEIRAGALASVRSVAQDAAAEIVAALGGKADADAVAAAVAARVKG